MLERERIGDTFVKHIETVYIFLSGKGAGAMDLLRDARIREATATIDNSNSSASSSASASTSTGVHELQVLAQKKANAVKYLIDTYTTGKLIIIHKYI